MQLKTLGESLNALNTIKSISSNNLLDSVEKFDKLTDSLSSYSVEVLKTTLSQKDLSRKQIEAILVAKGYQGTILETTTDELANIASTNALSASQKGAIGSTTGLGTAFKGLGASIKNATTSMLAFLTTTPVGWLMIAGGAC